MGENQIVISSAKDRIPSETIQCLSENSLDPVAINEGCLAINEIVFPDKGTAVKYSDEFRHEVHNQLNVIKWVLDGQKGNQPFQPLNCDGIAKLWDGCFRCPNYKTAISPLFLKSAEAVQHQAFGFHKQITRGKAIYYEPDPDDLLRFFAKHHTWRVIENTGIVYFFNGKIWEEVSIDRVYSFALTHFRHPEKTPVKTYWFEEFKKRVVWSNLVKPDWFNSHQTGFVNFNNGVLNLKTGELLPHSPEFSFRYCLDFDYDPSAACPTFDRFLGEVTDGDKDLQNIILEYCGYAACGAGDYQFQKSICFYGPKASNGKSTLADIIRAVLGKQAHSSVPLHNLNDPNARLQLDGKLANFSYETSPDSIEKSENFKSMVSGEPMLVKKLYSGQYMIQNTAKFFLISNEMFWSRDKTRGLTRRLLFIPFDAVFEGDKKDTQIFSKLSIERSGIFNRFKQGYERLIRQKDFSKSFRSDVILEEFIHANEPILQWVEECVTIDENAQDEPGNVVALTEMYGHFKFWCMESGYKAPGKISFRKRFEALYPNLKFKSNVMAIRHGRKISGFGGITSLSGQKKEDHFRFPKGD